MNKTFEDYFKVRAVHDEALEQLELATQRIVNVLKKVFKQKNAWWAFDYCENDENPLPEKPEDGYFSIYICGCFETIGRDYSNAFPLSFFDMTDAEIEKYLRDEIASDMAKEAAAEKMREETNKKKKEEKQKVVKSALSKLTAAERKALGI